MEIAKTVTPSFISETLLPDLQFELVGQNLVGANYVKQSILSHMELCFNPTSLSYWYQKYHSGTLGELGFKRRILLTGPPGTGKTTAAKACADYYARMTRSSLCFVELGLVRGKFVGESSKNIKNAFDYVKMKSEECNVIFFIDEFDSVGVSRNTEQIHDDITAMVNTLNQQMNLLNLENVFTIACSNFEGRIDYATKRRFDFILNFKRPNLKQRMDILLSFLEPFYMQRKNIFAIAKRTENYTQDDLRRLVNIAIERAFSQDRPMGYWQLSDSLREIKPTGEYA